MATRKKASPVREPWDLFKHGISASKILLWLACREQFRLTAKEGWRSIDEKLPFAFGGVGHDMLDQLRGKSHHPSARVIGNVADAVELKYRKRKGRLTSAQELAFQSWFGVCVATVNAYCVRWDGDWTGTYKHGNNTAKPDKWLASERRFKIPFVLETGQTISLNGIWDALFETKRQKLWVQDTKFLSRIDDGILLDMLPFDLQMNLYLWACWKEFDCVPQGVVFDIVRRPGHKQGKTEQLQPFLSRVAAELMNPVKFSHNFIRLEMVKLKRELVEWENTQLRPILEDIRMWHEGETPHYINPTALVSKYGPCDMFGPIVRGDFTRHHKEQRSNGKAKKS
jgi:hypothetical protein